MRSDGGSSSAEDVSYLDFEVEIGEGRGREYPLAVVRSPAGEASETMNFPFDELRLRSSLKDIEIAILRSGGKRRKILSEEEKSVQDFGQRLFDAVLTGEVRSLYNESRHDAAQKGKGLRLKLRISAPELAALPWEFMFDSRRGAYVCLSTSTPIVRYLKMPGYIKPLTVEPPLRILGMAASPLDQDPLDVEQERQRLEEAVKDLRSRGLVDLRWLEGQTWRDLMRAMRHGPWHVFHFVGHGGFDQNVEEGLLALANKRGQTYYLTATNLGRLLRDHSSLRLVMLNSCEGARGSERDIFSSTAATLVRQGIPAVLSMQYEIRDRAAIEFGRAFYEALADGMPVDAAVAEARKSISLAIANTVEWGIPVLHMRSPDGVLFQVQEPEGGVRRPKEPGAGKVEVQPAPKQTRSPKKAEVADRRGSQLVDEGDYERALVFFSRAVELDPKAEYYFHRGWAYLWTAEYEPGITDLNLAIDLDANNAEYYCDRATAHHWRDDLDEAIADLNRAIELDPKDADFYYRRGLVHTDKGEYEKATADLNRAIEIAPVAEHYFRRGLVYKARGNPQGAQSDLSRAAELGHKGASVELKGS